MENLFINKLLNYFQNNGIQLTQIQAEQFYNYFNLLIEWNNKFNLTAIVSEDEVIAKHFFDSAVSYNIFSKNAKVIDIGSGAGFPSVPLKILRPDLEFVLVDSVNKKVTFLNTLIGKLKLEKISAMHFRAEDLASNAKYREKFDYCVSRAVAPLNTLCEYCLPFVKINGEMLSYKASNAEVELNEAKTAISILGGKVEKVLDFSVDDYCRKIIKIKKVNSTKSLYPRKNNKPRIQPIK